MKVKLYFDGGEKEASSYASWMAYTTDETSRGYYELEGDNTLAEWEGLRLGLSRALSLGDTVEVIGDSRAVIDGILGRAKVRDRDKLAQVEGLLAQFSAWEIRWIPSEDNKAHPGGS